jgi:hypothetical protein
MRYSALHGLADTAGEVKEYFDVSVYRNILDMLNAFDTSTLAVANHIHNKLVPAGRVIRDALKFYKSVGKIRGKFQIAGPAFGYKPGFGKQLKVFLPIMNAALQNGGTQPVNASVLNPDYIPYTLIDLARSLEWEMNRVRLPVPNNFRQLNSMLSGRDYEFKVTHTHFFPLDGIDLGITDEGGLIPAIELLNALPQVKQAVSAMRDSVRREIDAANLAKKVQEETLRREQEELKAREEAARHAKERAIQIQKEKEAAYLRDYDNIAKRQTALQKEKADLNAELTKLESALSSAKTESEVQAAQARIPEIKRQLANITQEERNIDTLSGQLILAVQNIASENADLRQKIAQLDIARNREKSAALRNLESLLADAQAKAADKLDALKKEAQALADKKAELERQQAIAKQQADAQKAAQIENEKKAVEKQIQNNSAQAAEIQRVSAVDAVASDNGKAQQTALESLNTITTNQNTIQQQIADLTKQAQTATPEQKSAIAVKIADLQSQLSSLDNQKIIAQISMDQLQLQAKTLEQAASKSGPGFNINWPILGTIALMVANS